MALWRSLSAACQSSLSPRSTTAAVTPSRLRTLSSIRASASSALGDETVLQFQDVVDEIPRQGWEVPAGLPGKREPGQKVFYPKRGQDLELVCDSLAYKGNGVCKVVETGFVVLCERALPGERLIARIIRKKNGFAQAYKLKTLSVHHNAVAAPCQHFGDCGGCKTQNLAYQAQLHEKEQQVHDLISRIGRFGPSEPEGSPGSYLKVIVPCEKQFHYRNKMEFSFGTQKWTPREELGSSVSLETQVPISPGGKFETDPENFALGLHAPKRFDKILPINECLLQDEVGNQILDKVQKYCKEHYLKMPAYDVVAHKGFLRHLMIRTGRDCDTGDLEVMVNLVTSTYQPDLLQPLVGSLVSRFPQIVSFVNNVTSSLGPSSVGQTEHVLHGRRTITEVLRGLQFEISANSFFQTNTTQAEILYRMVEDECNLKGDGSEIILDLFCGTGTIGLSMAHKAKHVYGFEIVPEAVADARRNAERNGISNATFIQGDLNKLTAQFGSDFPRPDIVITDPNRPGMHSKLIEYLLNLRARRIVYVSCNPSTCARDLDLLCHGGEKGQGPQVYRLFSDGILTPYLKRGYHKLPANLTSPRPSLKRLADRGLRINCTTKELNGRLIQVDSWVTSTSIASLTGESLISFVILRKEYPCRCGEPFTP